MKRYYYLIVFIFIFLCKISFCDIIITGNHTITKCIKITNVDDYPEISFIGQTGNTVSWNYVITPTECITGGTRMDYFYLSAVNKNYLKRKDIKGINWIKDKNAVQSNIQLKPGRDIVDDSIPIYSKDQFYKILGFTDSCFVLFMWKEVTYDKNKNPLSENEFTYNGDLSKLSQQIPFGLNSTPGHPTFK